MGTVRRLLGILASLGLKAARTMVLLAGVTLAGPELLAQTVHDDKDCKYRDPQGDCMPQPLFSPREQRPQIIEIRSKPEGATVLVDNEELGKTPLRLVRRLRPGEHEIAIELAEYVTEERTVTIRPAGSQIFDID